MLLAAGDVPKVVDSATGETLATLQLAKPFTVLSDSVWVAGGTRIVGVTEEPLTNPSHSPFPRSVRVQVWNTSTGVLQGTEFSFDGIFSGTWISPNGAFLAIQTSDHRIEFWNLASDKLVSTTTRAVGAVESFAWSPDGAYLAVGIDSANWPSNPGQIQIWARSTGDLLAALTDTDTFEGLVAGLAWSPDGQYLAECSGEIQIWSTSTWQRVAAFGAVAMRTPLPGGKLTRFSRIESVTWAPDSRKLALVTSAFTSGPNTPRSAPQQTLQIWRLS
jgi:WD40 repeat protein